MKSFFKPISALMLAGAVLLPASAANAQQVCLTHEAAVTHLQQKFDESVVGRGLANDGKAMFELFLSENGTWTVIVSRPNGQSCVVAGGDSWQQLPRNLGQPAAVRSH